MERIANENHKEMGFCAYVGRQNPFKIPLSIGELAGYNADYSPRKILEEVFEVLAAYEDTGLKPEAIEALKSRDLLGALEGPDLEEYSASALQRADLLIAEYKSLGGIDHLRELSRAEKNGRLVVLPCWVTDIVYITEAVFENRKKKKQNKSSGERVVSAQIDHVIIGGTTGKPVFDLCTETGNWYYFMDPEQFYLTRDAAEAALKEREG